MSVQDLTSLLPPDYISNGILRTDRSTNTIYITGSLDEIKPIQDFIKQVDIPVQDRVYLRFDLKFIKARELLSLLPPRFANINPIALPDGNGIVALLSPSMAEDLQTYIGLFDNGCSRTPIRLRYIKTEDLLKNLPPSVTRDMIVDSGNGSDLFFVGSDDKRNAFLEDLAILDRPKAQIRYDILVVQYQHKDGFNLSDDFSINSNTSSATSPLAFLAQLTNVLHINFNIVSKLGFLFAVNLNSDLADSRAQIFADTTLHGTVGREVKLQSTSTYRYLDIQTITDSATGKTTTTGVTQQISSGLILVMNGWVSGDGMITIDISATVSDKPTEQSDSSSTSITTLPTTTECIVSTTIRTPSGKPIVIGGLRQRKSELSIGKPSILGQIPYLGKVFEQRSEKANDTEIVIYLVPYLTIDGNQDDIQSLDIERYYSTLIKGY